MRRPAARLVYAHDQRTRADSTRTSGLRACSKPPSALSGAVAAFQCRYGYIWSSCAVLKLAKLSLRVICALPSFARLCCKRCGYERPFDLLIRLCKSRVSATQTRIAVQPTRNPKSTQWAPARQILGHQLSSSSAWPRVSAAMSPLKWTSQPHHCNQ